MTRRSGTDKLSSAEATSADSTLRRSSRRAASTTSNGPEQRAPPTAPVENSTSGMNEPRRNPKRKASEAANQLFNLPDDLLEEALKPLTPQDIEDWEGWVELESEPAFFNIILRDLGVKDIKAQEIFTIDQSSLDILPWYAPGLDDGEGEDETGSLWFANQTTNNACATVALLNIVMNAQDVELGDNLRQFKKSTKDLNTVLRGHQISNNSFIRTIHNSFTRRMDHLNADLCLENEVSEAKLKKAKRRSGTLKKGNKSHARRKKRTNDDYGFHFTAYVPVDGYMWELDGLRSKPHKIGSIDSDESWTNVARPQIEARMLQYEESQLSFNLLALCQSPLALHSRAIAHAIASIRYLESQMKDNSDFANLISSEDPVLDLEDQSQLSEFNLCKSDVENVEAPDSLKQKVSQAGLGIGDAYTLHQRLVVDAKAAMGEFRAEIIALAEDEQRVKGRKKDYAQALHRWVQKLAEKGVLEEVIDLS